MHYEHFWSKNVTIFLPFFPKKKKYLMIFFKVKFDKCAVKLGKIYERFVTFQVLLKWPQMFDIFSTQNLTTEQMSR